jgi:transcriptional regulator of acetoin/glycerol metabolism
MTRTAEGTETASIIRGAGIAEEQPCPFLFVVLFAGDVRQPSSRHSLADIDEVVLKRGPSRVTARTGRRLVLELPDPAMSSKHARLLRASEGGFNLCDDGSKNGTLVNGKPHRQGRVEDGDLIEAGETFLLFHEGLPAAPGEALDLSAEALETTPPGLRTLHPKLGSSFRRLAKVAASRATVLVSGPTGTGKELVARSIHTLSGRKGRFVAVNCGAIAESLIESELFGHKKGAFSGAEKDREGLVSAAHRGTLFLDEIGELSMRAQVALLRVLQENEVTPVGATAPVPVDMRVVAATHRDLLEMVHAGTFREDLLARLTGFSLWLPTLAKRKTDLGLVVSCLLARSAEGDALPKLSADAARFLFECDWPQNTRQLEKALVTAQALAAADAIDRVHLEQCVAAGESEDSEGDAVPVDPERIEQQLRELLALHQGNLSRVAEVLGKKRQQIQRWCKKFGIDAGSFR